MSSGRTQPRRPSHLSGYAEACLQALAERGLGEKISVGGALGLLQRHWFLGEFLDALKSASEDSWIDGALYPDTDPPARLESLADRVDFLARLCAAWDFGLLPDAKTVAEIRRVEWREAVDACRLLTSPAYHLLRRWHNLPRLPYLGQQIAYIRDDPNLAHV